jgi:general secretion pathway protein J
MPSGSNVARLLQVSTRFPRSRGFTLLELLIGLTLVGFMLVLLFGGLRLGTRSWDAGEQRLDASTRMTQSATFIQSELGQLYPMRFHNPQGGMEIAFAGETGAIYFSGFLPPHVGLARLHLIALETRSGEHGQELVLRWHRADPDDLDFAALRESEDHVVLAKHVKKAEFAYFGSESIDAEPMWHEQWPAGTSLPSLVRLRLILENDQAWPEIVVPLLVEAQPT